MGESPTWSARERALYWVDVKIPALHCYDIATDKQRSWTLTSDVGGFALTGDMAGAVVALRWRCGWAWSGLSSRPAP